MLIEKGADVNAKAKDGGTALTLASEKGYTDIVELLKQETKKEDWKKHLMEGFPKIKEKTIPALEGKTREDYEKYLDEGIKLYFEGIKLYSRKNFTEAINLCNKAIEVDSTHAGPYVLLACCHFCLGNLKEGDKYLQSAFEINRETSMEVIKTQVEGFIKTATQIKSVKCVGNRMIIDEIENVGPYEKFKRGDIITFNFSSSIYWVIPTFNQFFSWPILSSIINNRRADTPVDFLKGSLLQLKEEKPEFVIRVEPIGAWMSDSKKQNEGKGSVSGTAFVTLGSGENRPIVLQKFMLLPYNPLILYQWIDSSKGMVVEEEYKDGVVSGTGTFKETTGISFQEINDYYLQASYDSDRVFVTSTDATGNFVFENVRVGRYILTTYLPLGSSDIFGVPVGISRVTWFVPVEVQAGKTLNILLDNSTGLRIPTEKEEFDRAFEKITPILLKRK